MNVHNPTLVWRGHPLVCDHCRVPEKVLPKGLLVCSRCKVARYCSPVCQKRDWKGDHRAVCPRLVEDRAQTSKWHRKHSERVPTMTALLSEKDKACEWVMNNAGNMFVITCAALKNDIEYARRHDVHVFLTQVDDHKNDAREYFVDEVAFNTKEFTKQTMNSYVFEGGAQIPDYKLPKFVATLHVVHPQGSFQLFHISQEMLAELRLPRDLSLDRFITFAGRGLTHLGASLGADSRAHETYQELMQQFRRTGYEFGTVDPDGTRRPFASFDQKGRPLSAKAQKYMEENRNNPNAEWQSSPQLLDEDHPMTKIVRAAYS